MKPRTLGLVLMTASLSLIGLTLYTADQEQPPQIVSPSTEISPSTVSPPSTGEGSSSTPSSAQAHAHHAETSVPGAPTSAVESPSSSAPSTTLPETVISQPVQARSEPLPTTTTTAPDFFSRLVGCVAGVLDLSLECAG